MKLIKEDINDRDREFNLNCLAIELLIVNTKSQLPSFFLTSSIGEE